MRTEARTALAVTRVPASRVVVFLLVAAAGLTWDLFSKSAVFTDLGYPNRESAWERSWLGGAVRFKLFTSFNEGALWGVGQGMSWLFASLSVLAALGILYWLFIRGAARSWWLTVALALIMAGTLGNLYDRLGWHGCTDARTGEVKHAVRDFLYFHFTVGTWQYDWPVFNFADTFLVTGAIMLVLQSLKAEMKPAAPNPNEPASTVTLDGANADRV